MTGKMGLLAAAMGAAMLAAPVQAATIIQTDNEFRLAGFDGFDTRLGTLNRVTLDVDIRKSRVFQLSLPSTVPTTGGVSWTVDGDWLFRSDNAALGRPLVPMTGAGSTMVSLDLVAEGRAFGNFAVISTGSGSLSFDPAQFLNRRTVIDGFYYGYNPEFVDTSFTMMPAGAAVRQLPGACFVDGDGNPVRTPEAFCGFTNYKLTYDYTPAVPEPATWGLMLVGFGAMGAALRRRRIAAVA